MGSSCCGERAVAALEARIGHRFRDPALLELALTHRSYTKERNNERLEFLGDALLGFVIGYELYQHYEKALEGELTLMRSVLVRRATLAALGRELGLGDFLRLGPGELKSGGYRRDSILSNAVEAIIGAVLLDAGNSVATSVILHLLKDRLAKVELGEISKDAKTRLQEYVQARGWALPDYEVINTRGSTHAREFLVACRVLDADLVAEERGRSRRIAEQAAAAAVLAMLEKSG